MSIILLTRAVYLGWPSHEFFSCSQEFPIVFDSTNEFSEKVENTNFSHFTAPSHIEVI